MKALERAADRIRASRDFLARLWRLENDERPGFLVGYVGPRMRGGTPVRSALFSTEGKDSVRDRLMSPEKYLSAQLEEIEGQLAFRGDFVPALSPAIGVVGIPSAFGCEVVWWEKDFPSVKPIRNDDPRRILGLEKPAAEAGELKRVLDHTRYFLKETGGRLPIRMGDIQGPLDSAALVFGHTEFFEAMRTHPAEAMRLMELVTGVSIDFVKAERRLVKEAGAEFVPSLFQPWIPDGWGVSVSNDAAVMISAEMHDRFCLPFLNRLSEEFGGISIHSCGNWTHLIPSLAKVSGLRGLEFGASETPFEAAAEAFGGRVVLACRVGQHRDLKFEGMADYVRRVLKAAKTWPGLFIHVDITNGMVDDSWPETDVNEIYRILEMPLATRHQRLG
jgi:uroporphyrinogen-III decarboxylase